MRQEPNINDRLNQTDANEALSGYGHFVDPLEQAPVAPPAEHPQGEVVPSLPGSGKNDSDRMGLGRMVEDLLRPPDIAMGSSQYSAAIDAEDSPSDFQQDSRRRPGIEGTEHPRPRVRPEDCNILMIAGEPRSAQRIMRFLSEYHVGGAADGASGLAKLISFKPDLVILDTFQFPSQQDE